MTFKKIISAFPFIILFCLLSLLCRELFSANPSELPSALVGKKLPYFSLPDLYNPKKHFTPANLKGHVSLLNVWASWCSACRADHPMMMKIKNGRKYFISYHFKPQL